MKNVETETHSEQDSKINLHKKTETETVTDRQRETERGDKVAERSREINREQHRVTVRKRGRKR